MDKLKSILKKLERYSDRGKLINYAVQQIEDKIIEMNRNQMYEYGVVDVNNPGRKLDYAESTKKAKKKAPFNRTDHITLKWGGDFHKSIKIKYNPDSIEFYSEDEKWVKWLSPQDRFDNALGLTDGNLSALREMIKDVVIKLYRDALQSA